MNLNFIRSSPSPRVFENIPQQHEEKSSSLTVNEEFSVNESSSIYDNTEFDFFLSELEDLGIIDENFRIFPDKIKDLKLPPLDLEEIHEICQIFTTPFPVTFQIDKNIKEEIKKKLLSDKYKAQWKIQHNIQILKKFLNSSFLKNDETTVFAGKIRLDRFFYHILTEKRLHQYSHDNQEDMLKIIGGYARKILKSWFRRALLELCGQNKANILPKHDLANNQKTSPDIDLRSMLKNATYEMLLDLQNKQQDIFAACFSPEPAQLEYYRFLIEKGGKKSASLFQKENICVKTSFGDGGQNCIDYVAAVKEERSRLFDLDAIAIPIFPLIKALVDKQECTLIRPESDCEVGGWQSVIDILGHIIHIHDPESVNDSGWARLVSFLSLGYRCPEEGQIEILTKNLLKDCYQLINRELIHFDNEKIGKKISLLLVKCYESHHRGNPSSLIAITFNSLQILERYVSLEVLENIWKKMEIPLENLIPMEDIVESRPYSLIYLLLRKYAFPWKLLSDFIQMIGFLNLDVPSNLNKPRPAALIKNDGKPAIQTIINHDVLLQSWNPLKAFQEIKKLDENFDLETIKSIEGLFYALISTTPFELCKNSRIAKNQSQLKVDFFVFQTLAEECLENPHRLIRSIGFQTLLLAYFHTQEIKVLRVILLYFSKIVLEEADQMLRLKLILSLENALQTSKYSHLIQSTELFSKFKEPLSPGNESIEKIHAAWILTMHSLKEIEFSSIISIFQKEKNFELILKELQHYWLDKCHEALDASKESCKEEIMIWQEAQAIDLWAKSDGIQTKQLKFLEKLCKKLMEIKGSEHTANFNIFFDYLVNILVKEGKRFKEKEIKASHNQTMKFIGHLLYLQSQKQTGVLAEIKIFQSIVSNKKVKHELEFLLLGQCLETLLNYTSKTQSRKKKKSETKDSFPHIEKEVAEVIFQTFFVFEHDRFVRLLIKGTSSSFLKSQSAACVDLWLKVLNKLIKFSSADSLLAVDLWNEGETRGVWKSSQLKEKQHELLVDICTLLFERNDSRLINFLTWSAKAKLSQENKKRINEIAASTIQALSHQDFSNANISVSLICQELILPNDLWNIKCNHIESEIQQDQLSDVTLKLKKLYHQDLRLEEKKKLSDLIVIVCFKLVAEQENKKNAEHDLQNFKNILQDAGLKKLLGFQEDQKSILIIKALRKIKGLSDIFKSSFQYFILELILADRFIEKFSCEDLKIILHTFNDRIDADAFNGQCIPEKFKRILNSHFPFLLKKLVDEGLSFEACDLIKLLEMRQISVLPSEEMVLQVLRATLILLKSQIKKTINIDFVHHLLELLKYHAKPILKGKQAELYLDLINSMLNPEFELSHPQYLKHACLWMIRVFSLNTDRVSNETLYSWILAFIDRREYGFAKLILRQAKERKDLDQTLFSDLVLKIANGLKDDEQQVSTFILENSEMLISHRFEESRSFVRSLLLNESKNLAKEIVYTDFGKRLKEGVNNDYYFLLCKKFQIYKGLNWKFFFLLLLLVKDNNIKKLALEFFQEIEREGEFNDHPMEYAICLNNALEAVISTNDQCLVNFFDLFSPSMPLFAFPELRPYNLEITRKLINAFINLNDIPEEFIEKIEQKILQLQEILLKPENFELRSEWQSILGATLILQKRNELFLEGCEYIDQVTDEVPPEKTSQGIVLIMEMAIKDFTKRYQQFDNIVAVNLAIRILHKLTKDYSERFDPTATIQRLLSHPLSVYFLYPIYKLGKKFLNQNPEPSESVKNLIKLLTQSFLENQDTFICGNKLLKDPILSRYLEANELAELNQRALQYYLKHARSFEDPRLILVCLNTFIKNITRFKISQDCKMLSMGYAFECLLNYLKITEDSVNFFVYIHRIFEKVTKECIPDTDLSESHAEEEKESIEIINNYHSFCSIFLNSSNDQTNKFKDIVQTLPEFSTPKEAEQYFIYSYILIDKILKTNLNKESLNLFLLYFVYTRLNSLMKIFPRFPLISFSAEHCEKMVFLLKKYILTDMSLLQESVFAKHLFFSSQLFHLAVETSEMKMVLLFPNIAYQIGMYISFDTEPFFPMSINKKIGCFKELLKEMIEKSTPGSLKRAFGLLEIAQNELMSSHPDETYICYKMLLLAVKKNPWELIEYFEKESIEKETLRRATPLTLIQYFHRFLKAQKELPIYVEVCSAYFRMICKLYIKAHNVPEPDFLGGNVKHILFSLIETDFAKKYSQYFELIDYFVDVIGIKISSLEGSPLENALNEVDLVFLFNHPLELTQKLKMERINVFKNWITKLINHGKPQALQWANQQVLGVASGNVVFKGFQKELKKLKQLLKSCSGPRDQIDL